MLTALLLVLSPLPICVAVVVTVNCGCGRGCIYACVSVNVCILRNPSATKDSVPVNKRRGSGAQTGNTNARIVTGSTTRGRHGMAGNTAAPPQHGATSGANRYSPRPLSSDKSAGSSPAQQRTQSTADLLSRLAKMRKPAPGHAAAVSRSKPANQPAIVRFGRVDGSAAPDGVRAGSRRPPPRTGVGASYRTTSTNPRHSKATLARSSMKWNGQARGEGRDVAPAQRSSAFARDPRWRRTSGSSASLGEAAAAAAAASGGGSRRSSVGSGGPHGSQHDVGAGLAARNFIDIASGSVVNPRAGVSAAYASEYLERRSHAGPHGGGPPPPRGAAQTRGLQPRRQRRTHAGAASLRVLDETDNAGPTSGHSGVAGRVAVSPEPSTARTVATHMTGAAPQPPSHSPIVDDDGEVSTVLPEHEEASHGDNGPTGSNDHDLAASRLNRTMDSVLVALPGPDKLGATLNRRIAGVAAGAQPDAHRSSSPALPASSYPEPKRHTPPRRVQGMTRAVSPIMSPARAGPVDDLRKRYGCTCDLCCCYHKSQRSLCTCVRRCLS